MLKPDRIPRQAPPRSEIVERNILALSGGPEEWRQRKVAHAEKHRARRALLRDQQAGQYESTVLQGQAQLEAEIARRSHERRLGLWRANTERLRARRARWAVLAVVANGASMLREAVVEGRRRLALRRQEDRAARIFQKLWRCYLITVRLAKLLRGRKLLRRGVYWWRMRHRIERKRATVLTLVEWLRNISETRSLPINRRIQLFVHRVTKVQRAWRRVALVLHAQIQVTLVHTPCTCTCHMHMPHAHAHATCTCACHMHTPHAHAHAARGGTANAHATCHKPHATCHKPHATCHKPYVCSRWSSPSGARAITRIG